MSFTERLKGIIFGPEKEKAAVPEAMVQEVRTGSGERAGTAIPGMIVHNVGTKESGQPPIASELKESTVSSHTPNGTLAKDPVAEAMKSIKEADPASIKNTKEKLANEEAQQTPPAPPVPSSQIPPMASPLAQKPTTPADSLSSPEGKLPEDQLIDPSHPSTTGTVFATTKGNGIPTPTMGEIPVTQAPVSLNGMVSNQQPEIPTDPDTTRADALREKYSADSEPIKESESGSISSTTEPRPLADMLQEAAQAPHIPSVKLPEETKIAEELVAEVKSPEGHADAIGKVLDDLAHLQKEENTAGVVSNSEPEQTTVVTNTTLPEAKATPSVASNDNTREEVLEVPSLQNKPLQKDGEEKDSEHTLEGAVKNIKTISQQIPQVVQTEAVEIKEDKKENTIDLSEKVTSESFAEDASFGKFQEEIRIILDEEGDAHLRDALEHLLDKEALRSALLKIISGTSDVPVIHNTPEQTHEYTTNNEQIEEVSMPTAYEISRAIKEANDNAQKQNNYGKIKNAEEKVERLLAA